MECGIFTSIAGSEKSADKVIGLTGSQMTAQPLFFKGNDAVHSGIK
jgi:hypothetical protein